MADNHPINLNELVRATARRTAWNIDLVIRSEIGGGKQSVSALKAIEKKPHATALTVSGLDQHTFERLVMTYGAQFSAIHFWKCPRIADLTPLEGLPNLTHVAYYWNQRSHRLWNFARTPKLRGLWFQDFTRVHDLADLRTAISLEELEFGNAVWVRAIFDSLDPLTSLVNLKTLSLCAKRISDGRIQPLASLRQLQSLLFPANQFTTEQIAWLRARLPDSLESDRLEPTWKFGRSVAGADGKPVKNILVVGKRKPWLSSTADSSRIKRYVDDFWRMVDQFKRNPEMQPE